MDILLIFHNKSKAEDLYLINLIY